MAKRFICILLIICFAVGTVLLTGATGASSLARAVRTGYVFYLNDKQVSLHAYMIRGGIYVDFYELAALLSGTEKQFSPSFAAGNYVLQTASDTPHRATSASLPIILPATAIARLSNHITLIDGKRASIIAYTIEGSHYFNLRDFARALDFNIKISIADNSVKFFLDTPFDASVSERIIDPTLPMVALTYDDGPLKVNTDRIVDILKSYNTVATFFVVGGRLSKEQDTVLRAFELGNEIANHTWNHPRLPTLSNTTIHEQLQLTNNAIKGITGVAPVHMRPPFGEINDDTTAAIAEIGMPVILWSIDPQDWVSSNSAQNVYDHIIERVKDGSIILLHDTHEKTVTVTEMLVPALLDLGYQLVTVSELFLYNDVIPVSGQAYGNAAITSLFSKR